MARVAVVETVTVTSGSMLPTLHPGDRLVVSKTTRIDAGDIVVLDGTRLLGRNDTGRSGPRDALARLVGADPATAYVKRVIGVAGDRVVCCTPDGRLLRNGEVLDEPYATGRRDTVEFDVTVPARRYWVLGDNRPESADSRSALGRPGGGMLRADDVIGEAVWRYWPRDGWGPLREPGAASRGESGAGGRTGARPVSEIGNTAEEIHAHPLPKESAP